MGEINERVLDIHGYVSVSESEPPALISPVFAVILLTLSFLLSTINKFLETPTLCGWFLFLLHVIFTGLYTPMVVTALVQFIEKIYMGKITKALYYMFDLEKSSLSLFRLAIFLVYWMLFMKPELKITTGILSSVFLTTCLWSVLKKVVMKHLACGFRDKDFFIKVQELMYQEYLYQTILSATNTRTTRLYTLSDALARHSDEQEHEQVGFLFPRVMNSLTNSEPRDIQAADLQKFMKKLDMENFLKLFKSEESRIIGQTALRNWTVKVCEDRKVLVDLLNPMSLEIKAIHELNDMGIPDLVYQIMSKSLNEEITFVFYMHWFDIGDCCIIDNQKMVVEDIGLYKTGFRNENNGRVYISNSSLRTKSIENLTRTTLTNSSRVETLEICATTKTSSQINIPEDLEFKIDEFLKSKPEIWRSGHSLFVKEADNKSIKLVMVVTHATKFENYEVNNCQISELVVEVKGILEELCSEYNVRSLN